MTLYIDSSAFVRRYLADEPQHGLCLEFMLRGGTWVTSRVTLVEVHRNLARATSRADAAAARTAFNDDLAHVAILEADRGTCALAIEVATETGARSLDALHIASALRVMSPASRFLTFDARQARAATEVGLTLATD